MIEIIELSMHADDYHTHRHITQLKDLIPSLE